MSKSFLIATKIPLMLSDDVQLSFQLCQKDFETIIDNAINEKEYDTSNHYLATGIFTGLTTIISSVFSGSFCCGDDSGYCFPIVIIISGSLCILTSAIAFKGYKKIITNKIKDYIMKSLEQTAIEQTIGELRTSQQKQ